MPETELVDEYHQQVFGHDEFMSVFLAAVNGFFQDGGCTFGLFDLCHFYSLSGSTVSLSGNPASRAILVAFRTFEVATS